MNKKYRKLAITRREYKRMKKAHKPNIKHMDDPRYAHKAYILWLDKRYFDITRTYGYHTGKTRRALRREHSINFLKEQMNAIS